MSAGNGRGRGEFRVRLRRNPFAGASIPLFVLGALGLFFAALKEGSAADSWETPIDPMPPSRLADLSIEELANIEIISLSRRSRQLHRSAAAVHVVTGEEIRRSGATSIPEALRMVPGLHVGRVDSHTWAVGSRGFSDVFANKQLVMIDGRSVNTPLFSGVFWDMHDTFMEDIDRIEVVRGPGGSLWGANAVSGVVNVVTKGAEDTQGSLMYAGSGNHERGFAGARYGGEFGDYGHFRIYGKHFERDNLRTPDESEANDRWYVRRGGFRTDYESPGPGRLTVQGDIYDGTLNNTFGRVDPDPPHPASFSDARTNISGGHLLGRLTHSGLAESDAEFQAYYDQNVRDSDIFREDRRTLDLQFQHGFPFEDHDRHYLMWGAGYRMTTDRIENSFDLTLDPDDRTDHLFSAFVQDEIELIEERLSWTLGSKFEHNDYTGFEVQPSTRVLWVPQPRYAVWASVARAVRTPSRAEHDIRLNRHDPESGALVSIFGQDGFRSEDMIAYELGYRMQPEDHVRFDFSLFYNHYNNLRSLEPRGDPANPPFEFQAENRISGETYGGEAAMVLQASEQWRWHFGYSLLRMHLRTSQSSLDVTTVEETEERSPRHQFFARSSVTLPEGWELDVGARYVDGLPSIDVPGYTQLDARLAWRPEGMGVEFSVVGQNLIRRQHAEAKPSFIDSQSGEVERGVYGKLTWQF